MISESSVDKATIAQLVLDNFDQGDYMARSMMRGWNARISKEQLLSIVGLSLTEAANNFDESHGASFTTFFYYYLRGNLVKEIQGAVENSSRNISVGDITDLFSSRNNLPTLKSSMNLQTPESLVCQGEIDSLCKEALDGLDELEAEVIRRYFYCDHSVTDIAKDLGYSRCHISRVKTKALKCLAKVLKHVNGKDTEEENRSVKLNSKRRIKESVNYKGGRGRRNWKKKQQDMLAQVA